jgi:alpha-L-arabinofuranosidase
MGGRLLIVIAAAVTGTALLLRPEALQPARAMSPATIAVHTRKPGRPISPLIFGTSIEWIDHGNFILDPKTGHLRRELIEPLKSLRIPVVRFPGGILSDHYHWRDGIGSRRPTGRNPMDQKQHENDFGTDEFIDLCNQLGSEALITANAGTGSLEELLAWQSHFASKKFTVKFWEIGNEIYLAENKDRATIPGNDRRIYKAPDKYAADFGNWAQALRERDRNALVGAIAGTDNTSRENRGWLKLILSNRGEQMDFISLHNAFAPLIFGSYDFTRESKLNDAYEAMFARAALTAEDIRTVRSQALAARRGRELRIAITEHFPLFGGGGDQKQIFAVLDQSKTVASALFTASLFHEFMRENVWMANYNITTSKWFGALLTDTDRGIIRTPTYHVFDLYRNHFGTSLVDVTLDGPRYDSKPVGTVPARRGVDFLDAVASRDAAGGKLFLAVVNRSLTSSIETAIDLEGAPSGPATLRQLAGPPKSINGPALGKTVQPNGGIEIKTSAVTLQKGARYAFPPSSISVFEWKVQL